MDQELGGHWLHVRRADAACALTRCLHSFLREITSWP